MVTPTPHEVTQHLCPHLTVVYRSIHILLWTLQRSSDNIIRRDLQYRVAQWPELRSLRFYSCAAVSTPGQVVHSIHSGSPGWMTEYLTCSSRQRESMANVHIYTACGILTRVCSDTRWQH